MLKILVPAGYMLVSDHGRLSVMICSAMAPQAEAVAMPSMTHVMAAMHDTAPPSDTSKGAEKAGMPCAFAGMTAQLLGAVDIVLITVALAAVALMALRSVPRTLVRPAPYLRPPLRGPPLLG